MNHQFVGRFPVFFFDPFPHIFAPCLVFRVDSHLNYCRLNYGTFELYRLFLRLASLELGGAPITWFDVGLGGIVKGSHPDLSYIRNRTCDSAQMNSKIYTSTSVLWSIYYSDDFFTKIYIRYRRGIHRYQYTISEKMSPNSTYYIVDFLTELSAYYYHTQG